MEQKRNITVGLFNKDSRIYFVNSHYVIMENPYNGRIPTLVKRIVGAPDEEDWLEINKALALVDMKLVGKPYTREDNLWCHEVKEVGDGDERRSQNKV
jgi:hypothetical protein